MKERRESDVPNPKKLKIELPVADFDDERTDTDDPKANNSKTDA
jgi:hypothetical protein